MSKKREAHNRYRNITISFRVTAAEKKEIFDAIKLTGLRKQDYIIKRLTNRDITVTPNPRVYKALKETVNEMKEELKKNNNVNEIPSYVEKNLKTINTMMEQMKGDSNG